MMALRKPRYRVDLSSLQAVCEANFYRLRQLMPDMAETDESHIVLDAAGEPQRLVLQVLERCPYTTTLRLRHEKQHQWLTPPSMEVRLYHDARMAEVIVVHQRRRFRSVYPYPNEQMLQPDEKFQLNQFLGEWLGYCHRHGQSAHPVLINR